MIAPHLLAQLALPQSILSPIETWAHEAIQRVINSLPEGLLIAFFAWAVLRVLPKQNSRTRFAVWFLALLAVVGIACLGGLMLTGINGRIFGASGFAPAMTHAIDLPTHWATYIFLAWLVGASAAMARLALSIWHLRRLRQSCTSVNAAALDPSIRQVLDDLNAAKTFASRPVTLTTSTSVSVPAALGIWKPMIALPTWALSELSPSDLAITIRHEFAHLRRWDDWTNLVQKMARAVFFFHPAVWWIESRLSIEREMACDDVVVAQTDNPMGYASCLLSLLERSLAQRGWTMAQAIVHRAREASVRLAQILDKNRPTTTSISMPALGLVGTFAVLCLAMLPQAPQFVAFDRNPLPSAADHEYSAALAQPVTLHAGDARTSLSPAVVPASFKIGGAKIDRMKTAKAKAAPSKLTAPYYVAAHKSVPAPELLIEVSAGHNFHPMMQTLVFVEAVQFMPTEDESSDPTFAGLTLNSPITNATPGMMWRVQVWHVTFVTPMWLHSARIPVANKI